MKIKIKKKRLLVLCHFVLISCIILSLSALYLYAEKSDISYERRYLSYPVFNEKSSSAPHHFINSSGDSIFNVIHRFQKVHGPGQPDSLSFSASTSGNQYQAWYDFRFNDIEKTLARKGDLAAAYSATLTNDRHWSFTNHWSNKLSYAVTTLGSAPYSHYLSGGELHSYNAKEYNSSTSVTMNNNYEFERVRSTGHSLEVEGMNLVTRDRSDECGCGVSKVSQMAVMLADLQGPAVKSIYTTRGADPGSSVFTQFHAGETIHIHLKFDEYIRFAGDEVTDEIRDMKLDVSLMRVLDSTEITGAYARASLVSLIDDTLTFKFVVPEKLEDFYIPGGEGGNEKTNYYLGSIDYDRQNWISTKDEFELKYVYKNPGQTNPTTIALPSQAEKDDLHKTRSLVVDLAGNPVDTVRSQHRFGDNCYLDNVSPFVRKVSARRPFINPNNSGSEGITYMTAGDKVRFEVDFNEEVLFNINGTYTEISSGNIGNIKAELNLADGEGTIVVPASRIEGIEGHHGSPKFSRLRFVFTAPDDARPIIYDDGSARFAGINKIYSSDESLILSDTRGNPYETVPLIDSEDRVMPQQQLWLDTVAPGVSTTIEESVGKYIPLSHQGGENPTEFYFPMEVFDEVDERIGEEIRDEYVSGINGQEGTFSWKNKNGGEEEIDKYPFEYYLGSVDVPEDADYKRAGTWDEIRFTQIEGGDGNVLHIRLFDDYEYSLVDTELVVRPVDHAGNTAEFSFPLDYYYDNIGPVITREGYSTSYDGSTETGKIETAIDIRDIGTVVEAIKYQWVTRTFEGDEETTQPDENAWAAIGFDIGEQFQELQLSIEDLQTDINHRLTLYVKTDNDTGGNTLIEDTTVERIDYNYDLTKPKYVLEFKTNPNRHQTKHSVHFYGAGKEYGKTIAMVKIEGSGDEYWVKSPAMPQVGGHLESEKKDIFDIPTRGVLDWKEGMTDADYYSYFAEWHRCTVAEHVYSSTITDEVYREITITRIDDLAVEERVSDNHGELSDLFNRHYGYLHLTLLSVYADELEVVDGDETYLKIPNHANIMREDYALKSSESWGRKIYDIDVTILADDGTPVNDLYKGTEVSEAGYPLAELLDGNPQLLRSFDGVAVQVDISNNIVPEWGVSEIDFESPGTFFKLIWFEYSDPGGSDPYIANTVHETSIKPRERQIVRIPANVAEESGRYEISLTLEHSGAITPFYNEYFIDRQTLDTYGVSKVESAMDFEGYEVPIISEYELSPGVRAAEIFLSSTEDMEVTFEADYTRIMPEPYYPNQSFLTDIYINVWSDETGQESGWKRLDDEYKAIFTASELLQIAGESSTLRYQFMLSSANSRTTRDDQGNVTTSYIPYTTPVQTLVLQAAEEAPSLEMAFEPDTATNEDVTATVHELWSSYFAPGDLTLYYAKKGSEPEAFTRDQELVVSENGTYSFGAYDRYHNYSVVHKEVDWIDKDAPELKNIENNSAGNIFSFTATITAESTEMDYTRLCFVFDDAYSSLLGFENTEEEPMVFRVPEARGGGTWFAAETDESGIFVTETEMAGNEKTITFEGAFKFDEGENAGEKIERVIELFAIDRAGNQSETREFTITTVNTKPECVSGSYGDNGFEASFSSPVILTEPAEAAAEPVYSLHKKHVPIYSNGDYTIEFTDIFGELYEQEIKIDVFAGLYDVDIALSETAPTNQDVVVTIDASENSKVSLGVPESDHVLTVETEMSDGKVIRAVITAKENCSIDFEIIPHDEEFDPLTRTVTISNIDRVAPTAELSWVFTADVDENGETRGEVIVSLLPNKPIDGINGKTTRHVFTLDNQEDYTFEFADPAGNEGEPVTASLSQFDPPVTIVEKTLLEEDTDPPEYNMSVFKNIPPAFVRVELFTREEYEALIDDDPFDHPHYLTSAMRLEFEIFDLNQTKILLLDGIKSDEDIAGLTYADAGETVPGISVAGNSIFIQENASFTAVIIDANDNKTRVPVVITRIDNIPPTGEIEYEPVGFNAVRAYIILSDNMSEPGDIKMLSTDGVEWDPEYNETGAYYHEFTENGSFTFTFQDEAGNIGTATAEVDSLDQTSPTVTGVVWTPSLIDADGMAVEDAPPVIPVNRHVTAQVAVDRNVRDVSAELLDDSGEVIPGLVRDDYYNLTAGATNITVRFKRSNTTGLNDIPDLPGVRLSLSFTALNGRSGTHLLELEDVIDLEPPDLTVLSDEPAEGYVQEVNLAFISDKPTYHLGSGEEFSLHPEGEPYIFDGETYIYDHATYILDGETVEENGTYTWRFADRAGNTTSSAVKITRIDNTSPEITITGLPKSRGQIRAWNEDPANAGNQLVFETQQDPVNLTVSMDKPGTITFGAEQTVVEADEEIDLIVDSNGRYGITAEDQVGNITHESFVVDCIDTVPPTITIARTFLQVKEGTSAGEFETAAFDGVYVTDNMDADMTGKYYLEDSLTQEQLDTPGSYFIEYFAEDSAGNTRTKARLVRVYDKNEPGVYINEVRAANEGTLFFTGEEISLRVSLPEELEGTEPYKLYYSRGLKTAGEVKITSIRLFTTDDQTKFTVTESGFYTVYLVTQSRRTMITYIYVQS